MNRIALSALAAVAVTSVGLGSVAFTSRSEAAGKAAAAGPRRYLPEYTPSGDLILPKNFERWVYVGSPLTPDALNDGKAGFPEFHNVYIEPGSYDIYKRTGTFPEGTIMFKELQRVQTAGADANGSTSQPSGRGYFPAALNGADVSVKDTKRYAKTGGWGYYNFNHHEPKAATAKLNNDCAGCHTAGAKKDMVWTQFYPRLDS
ncbi:MAG: cytochrome P460 [Proteobacteria bacterium SG_bin5]|nr:cytochrome P460 family protein [Sphingomonas sp.]OQW40603.1 MAG: cytochrome P460 [Proteobacteria bacterium SG_bin5]